MAQEEIVSVKVYSPESLSIVETGFQEWLSDRNNGRTVHHPSMIKLRGKSGEFWTFCKTWERWNGKVWTVARIGAGAWGDNTVYQEQR